VDYGEPEAAARRINEWVSRNTAGRIGDLVRAEGLPPLPRLVLTNATYFKAAWEQPFSEGRTAPAAFRTPAGPVEVPMMRDEGLRGHVTNRRLGLQAVSLAYEAMHAVVILPDEGAWHRVSEALSGKLVDRLVAGMVEKSVDLHLPRFEARTNLELADVLTALGLADLFGDDADLSGISPHPEGLRVSSVVHSATLTVDEAGTEAAAATALTVLVEGVDPTEPERVTMRVDRPFLFLVRDPHTGTVLFLARITDPTA
jgi:serpin B